jgi:uncharacterized repeat protein (TIGR01451 family)
MNVSTNLRLTIMILIVVALIIIIPTHQVIRAAGSWYVAPGGNDSNSCTILGAPCATINGAMGKAASGDTIYVGTGTYIGTGAEVVVLDRNVTLSGGWNAGFTTQSGTSTIDGEGARRGMTVNMSVAASIERFVVQNGPSGPGLDGGGIHNPGTLTLNNTVVTGNLGRGIYNNGTLTLNNSAVSGNTGGWGISSDGGTVTLNNSTVSGNTGWGIYNRGTLTLNNSALSANRAWDGGGIYNDYGTVTLNNSAVTGNSAAYRGGGIYNFFGILTLNNTTVSGNTATSTGGGIYNTGTLTLNNGTVSDNTANGSGGGIYSFSGTVTVQNSILNENTGSSAPNCLGGIGSAGYNLVGNTSGCTFTPGTGDLTNVSAHLGPLVGVPGNPRYRPLLSGSPAINAGNPAGCIGSIGPLTADQRGATRVGRCDIGAYEYTIPGLAANIYAFGAIPQHTLPFFDFWLPLQAVVLDSIGSPVNNVIVTFSAPVSGASGIFADSATFTTTAMTAESGVATAATFTANGLEGSYAVTATVDSVITPANLLLANSGWYVSPSGNNANDCQTPTTPCVTINGPLEKAGFTTGDTVLVATGTYTGSSSEVALLSKAVRLLGGWNGTFTTQSGTSTLDGQGARRGITVNSGATAIVERFTLQNGYVGSGDGGGIANSGNLTLNNSVVSNNKAYNSGGIYNDGTLTLNNSTVSGNTANYSSGGGILNRGTLILNNGTVSGNTAPFGGGIYNYGTLTLNSSTVGGNTATHTGGGIYRESGTVALQNSILGENMAGSAPNCSGPIGSAGYNLIGNISGCTFNSTSGDLTNVDAKLGPLEGSPDYHPLLLDSPAINAGNPAGCTGSTGLLITDQRGFPRFSRCDIGAYELQPVGFSTKTVNAFMGVPGQPLTYTIALTNGSASIITNIFVTDTLPINLTYHGNSLIATDGTCGFNGGVITWTGSLNAQGGVTLTFGTTVSQAASLGPIVNTAIISGGGEIVNRTATFNVDGQACNLTKYTGNPVLTVGTNGAWDDAAIWRPTVLKEGGTYKLWYSASDGATRRIGYATSPDGIHWTKSGGNPVLVPGQSGAWDAAGVYAPSVIYDGGVYKMWYRGRDTNGIGRIGYATSPDGITWTKSGNNPVLNVGSPGSWDGNEVTEPSVIKVSNTYHLWYVGNDGVTLRIGQATSADGIYWVKDAANPVLDLGGSGSWDWLNVYSPSVVKVGDEYKLWYSGGTLPAAYQTGYATSRDGSTWIRQQKLIAEGPLNTFDVYSADYPAVIVDSPGYKVWYSGVNSAGTYNIGYATVGVCGANPPATISSRVYLPIIIKGPSCQAYYSDSFSDSTSGWPISDDSYRRYAYTNGEYQILVKNQNAAWFVTPGAKVTDFTASVSARRASGTSGAYGILFGINEGWNEFYVVLIDANNYSVWRYNSGWSALKDWTSSPYIATGTNWNRLKVVRSGATISFYVNNHVLTTLSDSSFTGLRRIGLAAESDNTVLDARFDDFSLYPASCGASAYAVSSAAGQFEIGQPEARQLPLPPRLPQY